MEFAVVVLLQLLFQLSNFFIKIGLLLLDLEVKFLSLFLILLGLLADLLGQVVGSLLHATLNVFVRLIGHFFELFCEACLKLGDFGVDLLTKIYLVVPFIYVPLNLRIKLRHDILHKSVGNLLCYSRGQVLGQLLGYQTNCLIVLVHPVLHLRDDLLHGFRLQNRQTSHNHPKQYTN